MSMSPATRLVTALTIMLVSISWFGPGSDPATSAEAMTAPDTGSQERTGPSTPDALRALLRERQQVLTRMADRLEKQMQAGRIDISAYGQARVAALLAGLDLCTNRAERIEIHRKVLHWHDQAEAWTQRRYQSGRATETDRDRVRVARLEAEIELCKEELADQAGRSD